MPIHIDTTYIFPLKPIFKYLKLYSCKYPNNLNTPKAVVFHWALNTSQLPTYLDSYLTLQLMNSAHIKCFQNNNTTHMFPSLYWQNYTISLLGRKRERCNICSGCTSTECGSCKFCLDKPKFGGSGRKRQCCEKRRCLKLVGPGPSRPKVKNEI